MKMRPAMALVFGCLLTLVLSSAAMGQSAVAEPLQATPEANKSESKQSAAIDASVSLRRVASDIRYLSSDELAGRQPGKSEMKLAEDYIIGQFQQAGVAGFLGGDDYRQPFSVEGSSTVQLGDTALSLFGPDNETLPLSFGDSFTALIGRKQIDVSADLVFVGYGISAAEHNYNDYVGVDVKDKLVVMLRREPQQDMTDSVFDGDTTTEHSFIRTKVIVARKAGAAGIIFVNDRHTAPDARQDALVAPEQFGTLSFPFFQIKRETLDQVLAISPLHSPPGGKLDTTRQVEDWIDEHLEPISQPLQGWSATATASFSKQKVNTDNLIAVIEGEGPLADQTIVIGAHYDHIGLGAYGSREPWRKEVHNGADDNATGTAAVLELARRFAARPNKPSRRLVFVCFSAEEMGLHGSLKYVKDPPFPLETTAAMINFDMIGLLRENRLMIYNWNSSIAFEPFLNRAADGSDLQLVKPGMGFAGSDHLAFDQREVPNLFIHTGITDTYHTPDDDFETISCVGVVRIVDFSERLIDEMLDAADAPVFGKPKRFRLGLFLERDGTDDGVVITGVKEGSVAEAAGILAGDVVVSVDDQPMTKRRELIRVVRREQGNTVSIRIKRQDEVLQFDVLLADPLSDKDEE